MTRLFRSPAWFGLALGAVSCSSAPSDMGAPLADMAVIPDLVSDRQPMTAPDDAAPLDLAPSPDLTSDLATPDLPPPFDAIDSPDLPTIPDLTAPPDLATLPDLAGPPTLASVAPPKGPTTGNVTITINGGGFVPGATVAVNGVMAKNVSFVSAGQLTFTLPASMAFGAVPLVVTNPNHQSASANNLFAYYFGTLSFTPTITSAGGNPKALVALDFDGNNVLDVAVANCNDNTVGLLSGKGDGSFKALGPIAAGKCPYAIAAGNLRGNGALDLAVIDNTSHTLGILLSSGGGFKAGGTFNVPAAPAAVAFGNFDNDKNLDVAVASSGNGNLVILHGDGQGGLINPTPTPGQLLKAPRALAVGLFNQDAVADIALLDEDACQVDMYLGTGSPDFPSNSNPFGFATGQDPTDLQAADLNGDGALDLVVVNSGFKQGQCGNSRNSVSVLIGTGDGKFNPPMTFPAHMAPHAAAIADFNGDGKPDIAVSNVGSSDLSVLLGKGDGSFAAPANFDKGGSGTFGIVAGDFNGDGKIDLATSDTGADPGTVTVFLNTSH